jgi:hypothetical protein
MVVVSLFTLTTFFWLAICWVLYQRWRKSTAWLAAAPIALGLAITGLAAVASMRVEAAWLLVPIWILNALVCGFHLRSAMLAARSADWRDVSAQPPGASGRRTVTLMKL